VGNRIEAASSFTASLTTTEEITGYSGLEANASARAWLQTVTDDTSKDTAIAGVDTAVSNAIDAGTPAPVPPASETKILTVGRDLFTGTDGEDIIDGVTNATPGGVPVNTLTAIDVLNGGGGDDTILLNQGALVDANFGSLSSIEKMFTNGGVTVGVNANAMGLNTITASGTGGLTLQAGYNQAFTYTAPVNAIDTVDFQNQAAGQSLRVTLDTTAAGNGVAGSVNIQAEDTSGALTGGVSTVDEEGTRLVSNTDATLTFDVRDTDGSVKGVFNQVHLGDFLVAGDTNPAVAALVDVFATGGQGTDSYVGNTGNDYFEGGAGNDSLNGNGGNNTLDGGVGGDTVTGGAGSDSLVGGAGNDSMTMGTGTDNVSAGAGNDTIAAAAAFSAADTVSGGAGTDTMTMTAVAVDSNFANVTDLETISVTAAGSNALGTTAEAAGITNFIMNNGAGNNDTVAAATYTTGLNVTLGGGGSDIITTGNGNSSLSFGSNDELQDNDTVTFGSGADTLAMTAASNVVLQGTVDLDDITGLETIVVNGSTGTDVVTLQFQATALTAADAITVDATQLTGISDSITMTNASGTQPTTFSITGGVNGDTLVGAGAAAGDTIDGGAGNDQVTGGGGNDSLIGGAGSDTITIAAGTVNASAGDANDTIAVVATLSAADTISGGAGTDTMTMTPGGTGADAAFANVSDVETLGLTAGAATLGANAQAAGVTTIAMDTAGGGADTLTATAFTTGLTVALGDGGGDIVSLSNSNNIVSFASNDEMNDGDTIAFGSGADTLAMTAASNVVLQGTVDLDDVTGLETIVVSGSTGTDVVTLQFQATAATAADAITVDATQLTGASDTITMTNNSGTQPTTFSITGGVNGDTLAGGGAAAGDTIIGNGGNDQMAGNQGNDVITGGAGSDNANGGAGNDTITTAGANDTITAGAGNDNVDAGAADDSIVMGGNLTFDDVIDGGANGTGGDTLSANALGTNGDINFLNTSNVESLVLGTGVSQIGLRAQTSGVTAVTLVDGAGVDTLTATTFTTGLTVTAGIGNDSISLGSGNDNVVVDSNDEINVNDTITFGSGSDTITTTAAAGVVNGVSLDLDNITGLESIVLSGTTGADASTVQFAAVTATTSQTITIDGSSATGATDNIVVTNASARATTTFNITSGAGADSVQAGSGADTVATGGNGDTVVANQGNDSVNTGLGNDSIVAGLGNDTIDAGAGNDTITSGNGSERITLGTGTDQFNVLRTNTNKFVYSTITDLTFTGSANAAQGLDQLNFFTVAVGGANETFNSTGIALGANATFADYLDAAVASNGTQGELSWFQFNGNTYIAQDNNAAAVFTVGSDMVVEIAGLQDLSTLVVGDGTLT
jgi:Ca2+-binding RTX toxin-like protein